MNTRFESPRRRVTAAPAVGAITSSAVLAALAGPVGIAAGGLAAVAALGAGPVAGVAVAHLAAVLLLGDPSALDLVAFELGVAPLLATPLVGRPARRDIAVLAGVLLGLGGVVLAGPSVGAPWAVAGTVLCSVALVGYALHRYELVVLGLVADAPDRGDASTRSDSAESRGGDT